MRRLSDRSVIHEGRRVKITKRSGDSIMGPFGGGWKHSIGVTWSTRHDVVVNLYRVQYRIRIARRANP